MINEKILDEEVDTINKSITEGFLDVFKSKATKEKEAAAEARKKQEELGSKLRKENFDKEKGYAASYMNEKNEYVDKKGISIGERYKSLKSSLETIAKYLTNKQIVNANTEIKLLINRAKELQESLTELTARQDNMRDVQRVEYNKGNQQAYEHSKEMYNNHNSGTKAFSKDKMASVKTFFNY